jgi:hypothetical protein
VRSWPTSRPLHAIATAEYDVPDTEQAREVDGRPPPGEVHRAVEDERQGVADRATRARGQWSRIAGTWNAEPTLPALQTSGFRAVRRCGRALRPPTRALAHSAVRWAWAAHSQKRGRSWRSLSALELTRSGGHLGVGDDLSPGEESTCHALVRRTHLSFGLRPSGCCARLGRPPGLRRAGRVAADAAELAGPGRPGRRPPP